MCSACSQGERCGTFKLLVTFHRTLQVRWHFRSCLEGFMVFDAGHSLWQPIVAVPARNEAQRLPSLIDSLGQQTWLAGAERRLPIILVLNNCNDHSAVIAVRAAAQH